jgi:hypothetical protein
MQDEQQDLFLKNQPLSVSRRTSRGALVQLPRNGPSSSRVHRARGLGVSRCVTPRSEHSLEFEKTTATQVTNHPSATSAKATRRRLYPAPQRYSQLTLRKTLAMMNSDKSDSPSNLHRKELAEKVVPMLSSAAFARTTASRLLYSICEIYRPISRSRFSLRPGLRCRSRR